MLGIRTYDQHIIIDEVSAVRCALGDVEVTCYFVRELLELQVGLCHAPTDADLNCYAVSVDQ